MPSSLPCSRPKDAGDDGLVEILPSPFLASINLRLAATRMALSKATAAYPSRDQPGSVVIKEGRPRSLRAR